MSERIAGLQCSLGECVSQRWCTNTGHLVKRGKIWLTKLMVNGLPWTYAAWFHGGAQGKIFSVCATLIATPILLACKPGIFSTQQCTKLYSESDNCWPVDSLCFNRNHQFIYSLMKHGNEIHPGPWVRSEHQVTPCSGPHRKQWVHFPLGGTTVNKINWG